MYAKPIVSVVMPVFNGERYLAPTIESILGQTLSDFEFVIVNDGSNDDSRGILDQYARRDRRIIIIDQENAGISAALNTGVERVTAPYLAPLDQDDISLPHRLQVEVTALEANSNIVCVGGWCEIIDAQGRYLTTIRTPRDDNEIQRLALAGHTPICHSGCMMRRWALLKVGGYNPEFDLAQDLDLFLRLGEIGGLQNLEVPVLRYRLHNASSSEKSVVTQRDRMRTACERAWVRRGTCGVFEAVDLWRPGPSRASQHQFALLYGWWAFNSSERKTAIIYGLRAIRARPFTSAGWKLLACALLKPFGAQR